MIAKPAHVDHQIVVAEGAAALGQHDFRIPGGRDLFRGQTNILRRDELAFLDIHDAAGAAGFDQKIRLAAQEGRDLQDVDGLGGFRGLRRLVDVGKHGESGIADGLRECAGLP